MNKYCLQPKLSPSTHMKINALFQAHEWTLDTDNSVSLYNRFCSRLSHFSLEEQDLIIDLTKRFLIIPQRQYLTYFKEIIRNESLFEGSIIESSSKLYILPLITKEDIGKIKSASFLWYSLKSTELKYEPFLANKSLNFYEGPQNLSNKINSNANACLLLVDDYIGSGTTAESAVMYCTEHGISADKIGILSIAAQRTGIEYLKTQSIMVYTNTVLNRGISDWYTDSDLTHAIATMKKIEKKLNVSSENEFGYKQSEALIMLSRTPNNTFPVFWLEKGQYKIAPFPR